jgi:hypothetical protein
MLSSLRRLAICFALTGAITGCLALVGHTPQQRLYGAVTEYTLAVSAAADYCSKPDASVERCRALGTLSHQADNIIKTIDAGLTAGTLGNNEIADLLRVLASILEQMETPR